MNDIQVVETEMNALRRELELVWKEVDALKGELVCINKRFTQILITLIFVLVGVIATYFKA